MKKRHYILLSIPVLLYAAIELSGNSHIYKAVAFTYLSGHSGPTLEDSPRFANRHVRNGEPAPLEEGNIVAAAGQKLIPEIESYDPAALLVVRRGKVVYEKYWGTYSDTSRLNSFSVAKSIIGLCILRCIEEGLIRGMDQHVTDFIPELRGAYREKVTIGHLMDMTSGMNFDESYSNPFGFMSKAYYGDDLIRKTLSFRAEIEPGKEWKYLGGNTILLSIIIARASGMNISDFASKHFWKKLGAGDDALWSLDAVDGVEKAYCCYYASARDMARYGLLLLNHGRFNGEIIIDSSLLSGIHSPALLNDGSPVVHYSLHWWLVNHGGITATYARGIKGQYLIVIPEFGMVVVRQGNKRGDKDASEHPKDLYLYLELARSIDARISD